MTNAIKSKSLQKANNSRLFSMYKADLVFQAKYGFYLLYAFFSLFYSAIIIAVPQSWKQNTASVLIYTDPATLGLFFIGAIVLFEKSQRVLDSINIAPVSKTTYIFSKVLSIGTISIVVALILAFVGGKGSSLLFSHPIAFICGIFLSSSFYTLLALCVGSFCNSLNAFILLTVPIEILFVVPAVLYLFGVNHPLLILHPASAMIDLIKGTYGESNSALSVLGIAYRIVFLLAWNVIAFLLSKSYIKKMFSKLGGVKI